MIGALLARTILALDTPNLGQACEWVQQYRERVYAFKIGGALAIGHGLPIVRTLREAGATRVFLDLKFHDIPHAVALAVRQAAEYGVWMLTLHCLGGAEMLRAARGAVADLPNPPLLMGVTVLTSLDADALREVGIPRTPRAQVVRLAQPGARGRAGRRDCLAVGSADAPSTPAAAVPDCDARRAPRRVRHGRPEARCHPRAGAPVGRGLPRDGARTAAAQSVSLTDWARSS
jgi:orotidine-5'-phosphate decarboxylase